MSTPPLSSAIGSSQISEQVGYAVMNKQRAASKQQGDAAVALIESAREVQEATQARAEASGGLDVTA